MTDSLFPEPETLFSEPEHEPLWSALQLAGDKPPADADRGEKKNYAQRLSNQLAQTVADALRPLYPNITPTASGEGQEATVDVAKGRKRLDVKALDPTLGLILCVSIKTYNFQDYSPRSGKLGRWTKNIVRNDHELRGEAMVLHQRQPYSVLVAVMFEPYATCDDGDPTKTSDTGKSSLHTTSRRSRSARAEASARWSAFRERPGWISAPRTPATTSSRRSTSDSTNPMAQFGSSTSTSRRRATDAPPKLRRSRSPTS
ncbi:hypothetical protein ACQGFI_31320 [Rhodococcus sp. 2.95]